MGQGRPCCHEPDWGAVTGLVLDPMRLSPETQMAAMLNQGRPSARPQPPAERIDAFLPPYYGWIIERLVIAIQPHTQASEVPGVDRDRPCRTADVFTTKDVREVARSARHGRDRDAVNPHHPLPAV